MQSSFIKTRTLLATLRCNTDYPPERVLYGIRSSYPVFPPLPMFFAGAELFLIYYEKQMLLFFLLSFFFILNILLLED